MARRRNRPRTDDTNWGPRDDVRWYWDQVKAAPGAAAELFRAPRTIAKEAREMVREMRSDDAPIADDDPVLRPVDGVDFDTWVEISAAILHRRIGADDPAGRDAVGQEHGIDPGAWARASEGWEQRRSGDPRVAQRFARALRTRLTALGH